MVSPTMTSKLAVTSAHPPVPVTVYLIVAVPAATPLTTPVEASTVATAVSEDDQDPPV